jgi:hypothetical protein
MDAELDEDNTAGEQPAIIYKGKKPYKMIGVYLMGDVRRRQRATAAVKAGCARAPHSRAPPISHPPCCVHIPRPWPRRVPTPTCIDILATRALQVIGEGAQGKVREALHSETLRRVAIKIVNMRSIRRTKQGEEALRDEIAIHRCGPRVCAHSRWGRHGPLSAPRPGHHTPLGLDRSKLPLPPFTRSPFNRLPRTSPPSLSFSSAPPHYLPPPAC